MAYTLWIRPAVNTEVAKDAASTTPELCCVQSSVSDLAVASSSPTSTAMLDCLPVAAMLFSHRLNISHAKRDCFNVQDAIARAPTKILAKWVSKRRIESSFASKSESWIFLIICT